MALCGVAPVADAAMYTSCGTADATEAAGATAMVTDPLSRCARATASGRSFTTRPCRVGATSEVNARMASSSRGVEGWETAAGMITYDMWGVGRVAPQ